MKNFFPIVAVIPSLNPDKKLSKLISRLVKVGFTDIIIVNDGSKEENMPIFEELKKFPQCVVLCHKTNLGKGRALKTAFSYYLQEYAPHMYQGVVTADADGQHLPEDIFNIAHALQKQLGGVSPCEETSADDKILILGTRNFDDPVVPVKSKSGNKITTIIFQFLYGKRINDTQTGLRGISNNLISSCLNLKGERFEYEINMLIKAVLNNVKIAEETIHTVYLEQNTHTHFHPIRDSFRIYRILLESFLKFSCSGILSMIIDQSLFAILFYLCVESIETESAIAVATLLARASSSYINYYMNRTLVFKADKKGKGYLKRYYMLCIMQAIASGVCVSFLYGMMKIHISFLKLIIDFLLFIISYQIQYKWVYVGR